MLDATRKMHNKAVRPVMRDPAERPRAHGEAPTVGSGPRGVVQALRVSPEEGAVARQVPAAPGCTVMV